MPTYILFSRQPPPCPLLSPASVEVCGELLGHVVAKMCQADVCWHLLPRLFRLLGSSATVTWATLMAETWKFTALYLLGHVPADHLLPSATWVLLLHQCYAAPCSSI